MQADEIVNRLKANGNDMAAAMERMAYDEGFYVECLELFYNDGNFVTLGEHLAEGRTDKAFESAHALKGVAANLGLTAMFDCICSIVEPLRAGKTHGVRAGYKRLMKMRAEIGKTLVN